MKSALIQFWKDENPARSAAENMALDEVLFLSAIRENIVRVRFYTWSMPAVTVGYFERPQTRRGVRRMTGGGTVEHGNDVTFSLAFPGTTAMARASGPDRYRHVHESLTLALNSAVHSAQLLVSRKKSTGPCFASPVQWDIIDPASGSKIAGGAQRRSRGAVMHQGSVRVPDELRSPHARWVDPFLQALAEQARSFSDETIEELIQSSKILVREKYETKEWNTL